MSVELLVLGLLVLAFVVVIGLGDYIPTPIPEHLVEAVGEETHARARLLLWRIALIVGFLALGLYTLVIDPPTGVLAFVIPALVLWVFLDDIQQTLLDLWNADFWRIER